MGRVPKYVRNVNPKENPKKIYLIICEGKNNQTEKKYFLSFNRRTADFKIEVESTGYTDPKNMLNLAVKYIKKHDIDFEHGDSFFV